MIIVFFCMTYAPIYGMYIYLLVLFIIARLARCAVATVYQYIIPPDS